MNSIKFLKNGITLIILLALFSVKLVAQDTIRITWQGTAGYRGISIQAIRGIEFIANWGDGTKETIRNKEPFVFFGHTYATAGEYMVTITPLYPDCRFTYLSCQNGQLTKLDLTGCSELKTLYCQGNKLTNLTLTGCSKLETLRCEYNQLTTIDLTDCTVLQSLNCYDNQLIELDLTSCSKLKDFSCATNQLTNLDLTNCLSLENLYCQNNQLTELDLTGCTALFYLNCSYNKLKNVDLTDCSALRDYLNCSNNQLTNLDLTSCSAFRLRSLHCDNNQLTNLDLTGYSALKDLYCQNNQLKNLDLTGCLALSYLDCNTNQLKNLDLTNYSALSHLNGSYNQFTNLDLTGCSALSYLDLTGCLELELLYCQNNQLKNLILTDCSALQTLYCYNNKLQLSDLYAAHLLINAQDNKWIGTQYLLPQTVKVGEYLFGEQSVFNEKFTNYTITQNGDFAPQSAYTIMAGMLNFNIAGNYTVSMTNSGIVSYWDYPAEVIIELTVEQGSGIVELMTSNLTVYPNPTNDKVYIKTENEIQPEVKLYAIEGKLLQHIRNTEINLSGYTAGVYILSIDGKMIKIWKK